MRIGHTGRKGDRKLIAVILCAAFLVFVVLPLVVVQVVQRQRTSPPVSTPTPGLTDLPPGDVGERPQGTVTRNVAPSIPGLPKASTMISTPMPTPTMAFDVGFATVPPAVTVEASSFAQQVDQGAAPPILLLPPQGTCTTHRPTLQWEGQPDQTYYVVVKYEDGNKLTITTPLTTWIPPLPGENIGCWSWHVTAEGRTSPEWFFWFDPLGCDRNNGPDDDGDALCAPGEQEITLDDFSSGDAQTHLIVSNHGVFTDAVITRLYGAGDPEGDHGLASHAEYFDLFVEDAPISRLSGFEFDHTCDLEHLLSDIDIGDRVRGKQRFRLTVKPSFAATAEDCVRVVVCLSLDTGLASHAGLPSPTSAPRSTTLPTQSTTPMATSKPVHRTPTSKPGNPTPTPKPGHPTPTPKPGIPTPTPG